MRTSHLTGTLALALTLGFASFGAQAGTMTAVPYEYRGDACDVGTGPSFDSCTLNGSPTIMKINFDDETGGANVEVNSTVFPSLSNWYEGALDDLDGSADFRFEANGFTLWLNEGLRSGSWLYDGNGPEVTYFVIKNGNNYDIEGTGSTIRQSTFSGLDKGFAHITFYDTGDQPYNGVPLPGTVALLGLGLFAMSAYRRRG